METKIWKTKVCVLGNQNSGKSSIINKFISDTFCTHYSVQKASFSQLSELILYPRPFSLRITKLECNYGILQVDSVSGVCFLVTYGTPK